MQARFGLGELRRLMLGEILSTLCGLMPDTTSGYQRTLPTAR